MILQMANLALLCCLFRQMNKASLFNKFSIRSIDIKDHWNFDAGGSQIKPMTMNKEMKHVSETIL